MIIVQAAVAQVSSAEIGVNFTVATMTRTCVQFRWRGRKKVQEGYDKNVRIDDHNLSLFVTSRMPDGNPILLQERACKETTS